MEDAFAIELAGSCREPAYWPVAPRLATTPMAAVEAVGLALLTQYRCVCLRVEGSHVLVHPVWRPGLALYAPTGAQGLDPMPADRELRRLVEFSGISDRFTAGALFTECASNLGLPGDTFPPRVVYYDARVEMYFHSPIYGWEVGALTVQWREDGAREPLCRCFRALHYLNGAGEYKDALLGGDAPEEVMG